MKWAPDPETSETSKPRAVPRPLRVAVSPLNGLEPGGLHTGGKYPQFSLGNTYSRGIDGY